MDEESTKLDEEYDDLAMQDFPDNNYMSDDEDELFYQMELSSILSVSGELSNNNGLGGDKYQQNLDLFMRTKDLHFSDSLMCSLASPLKFKNEKRAPNPGNCKLRKRSLSIPAFGKHGSLINVPNQ